MKKSIKLNYYSQNENIEFQSLHSKRDKYANSLKNPTTPKTPKQTRSSYNRRTQTILDKYLIKKSPQPLHAKSTHKYEESKSIENNLKSPFQNNDKNLVKQQIEFQYQYQDIKSVQNILKGEIIFAQIELFGKNISSNFESMIKLMGGEITKRLTKRVTLMVTNTYISKHFQKATQLKIPVVNILWITDSLTNKKKLEPQKYIISEINYNAQKVLIEQQKKKKNRNSSAVSFKTQQQNYVRNKKQFKNIINFIQQNIESTEASLQELYQPKILRNTKNYSIVFPNDNKKNQIKPSQNLIQTKIISEQQEYKNVNYCLSIFKQKLQKSKKLGDSNIDKINVYYAKRHYPISFQKINELFVIEKFQFQNKFQNPAIVILEDINQCIQSNRSIRGQQKQKQEFTIQIIYAILFKIKIVGERWIKDTIQIYETQKLYANNIKINILCHELYCINFDLINQIKIFESTLFVIDEHLTNSHDKKLWILTKIIQKLGGSYFYYQDFVDINSKSQKNKIITICSQQDSRQETGKWNYSNFVDYIRKRIIKKSQ